MTLLATILFSLASAQAFYLNSVGLRSASSSSSTPDTWAPLVIAVGTALAAVIAAVFAGLASLHSTRARQTTDQMRQDMVIPSQPEKPIGTAIEHIMQGQSAMVDTVVDNVRDTADLKTKYEELRQTPSLNRRQEDQSPPPSPPVSPTPTPEAPSGT